MKPGTRESNAQRFPPFPKAFSAGVLVLSIMIAETPSAWARQAANDDQWARVTEDEFGIRIETDKLEAVIPKQKNKRWMTGIEKQSFLDKTTGFREVGDGLMVVDWLLEAGSDEAYGDQILPGQSQPEIGRYLWHTNETTPAAKARAISLHGSTHRKRQVEGPQLCAWMKPVQPEVIRGVDFVAVKTTCRYEFAAPGRQSGSRWTQLVVFPKGERYFVLMDKIDSVNDSDEMLLRTDMPGCVRHTKGDTFSEMYLSYLGGPQGLRIPSGEFLTPFPPDTRFHYRRDPDKTPGHFIRAYRLRDPQTGADGPWLAGMTLEPSVVCEAWCAQWPGDFLIMILEVHGRPVRAGESFSAVHVVGYFGTIEEMHTVYDRYKGHTGLTADRSGWRLMK